MQLIDGRKLSTTILEELKLEVSKLKFQPGFCDILVGKDPVSATFVNIKAKAAERIGLRFIRLELE